LPIRVLRDENRLAMQNTSRVRYLLLTVSSLFALVNTSIATEPYRRVPLTLTADDVVPTGNEWISLPTIRASDAALVSFNVLSMKSRGLLEVTGGNGTPVLKPYVTADGKALALKKLSWELIEYWIPVAHFSEGGLDGTITYCAPPGSRAAFLSISLTNRRTQPLNASMGLKASWGALNRVTYTTVALAGTRTLAAAPWIDPGEVFSFVTSDTQFSWSLVYPGSRAQTNTVPISTSPSLDASRELTLAPGEKVESNFVLAPGVEEFSAAHNARALRELLDRVGAQGMIAQTAAWCAKRTRTTGDQALDTLMNRNFLFTALYAWGRTIDTEQLVGVTSRSPRYYVSAAYWDRDAMLWSFPALLDVDKKLAREALEYALGPQLRNTGTHSRFIDGIVLEDGFQLDEAAAPVSAIYDYVKQTGDIAFLQQHREALVLIRDRLLERFDPASGLFSTLQDSQDEYEKLPFLTYSNALTFHSLTQLSELFTDLKETNAARDLSQRAAALHKAVLTHSVANTKGATGPIFVSSTDATSNVNFAEIPPGSLMKLPLMGFVSEDDPTFIRTYDWLHSPNYEWSYSAQPFGLPGSYRLPFTTSWSVADHLRLKRGRTQALKILTSTKWDGGIISEGVSPATGEMDLNGRAFATAAGYVAHAICEVYCTPGK
jgi:uncharacterized protein